MSPTFPVAGFFLILLTLGWMLRLDLILGNTKQPPPSVSMVCHYLKPKHKLSWGASDGIYGGRGEQHL